MIPHFDSATEAETGQTVDDDKALATLWHSLTSGSSKIVDVFSTSDRLGMVVASHVGASAGPVAERDLGVLERVMISAQQKSVGFDVRVSPAGLNRILMRALAHLGLDCTPSRLPLLLVVAAHAARTPGAICSVRVGTQRADGALYQSVTLHDATAWLQARLTPSQSKIANLLIEGKTHAEIADRCNIVKRTVANHLAAVYGELRLSGRLALLSRLATDYVRGDVPYC